jgi:ribosomal protein S18 acetylase RimI-like enzyme
VLGGPAAYELVNYYSEGAKIFIYHIAVKPEFQRHGAGKKLITSVKEYCRENGIREFLPELIGKI